MLVGDARGLHIANWGRRWSVIGKWYELRCNFESMLHI